MHFITVDSYSRYEPFDKVGKRYLNIDSIATISLKPSTTTGHYWIHLNSGNGDFDVNAEDCQRILDEIQKYNGQ